MTNLLYDIFDLYRQSYKKQHWLLKLINYILLTILIVIAILSAISLIELLSGWKLPRLTITQDGFAGESLYDLMEKEAQISNDVYLQKIRDADVIQSNPWIMVEPVNKNATIHPKVVLDRLTGQQPDQISSQPRSYYEYSDVLYTGLPL